VVHGGVGVVDVAKEDHGLSLSRAVDADAGHASLGVGKIGTIVVLVVCVGIIAISARDLFLGDTSVYVAHVADELFDGGGALAALPSVQNADGPFAGLRGACTRSSDEAHQD
jgi:hypothetical protein